MKTKRAREVLGSPPKVFHPDCSCIAYSLGETEFIQNNLFTPATKRRIRAQAERRAAYFQDPNIPIGYKISPSDYYRDQIARCLQWPDSGKTYTEEVESYVIQAVKQFGIDALRLNANDELRIHPVSKEEMNERAARSWPPKKTPEKTDAPPLTKIQLKWLTNRKERSSDEREDSSAWISDIEEKPEKRNPLDYLHPDAKAHEEAELNELRQREGLGPVICDVLRFWREQAERGPLDQRQRAIKHLKAFGKALIPEARGKRKNTRTASAYQVTKFYLKELYRLYHVEHALKSSAGPRNFTLKVKQASESYGLPVESIREFLGLDETDNPDRQPFSTKDMAREITSRQFKITHRTVSNLLSS